MHLKNRFFILGFASLIGFHAQAQSTDVGLFLEPAVTYEIGSSTVDYPSPLTNSTGKANGFGLGGRLGMHVMEKVFLGLDARYSRLRYQDWSVSYDADSTATNWGPVLGAHMPVVGVRLWGSLILGGEVNPERSDNFDVAFSKASGYRLGTGFRLTLVSLNLEYQNIKYGDTQLERAGPFTSGSSLNNVELENKSWIASVSFPIEL